MIFHLTSVKWITFVFHFAVFFELHIHIFPSLLFGSMGMLFDCIKKLLAVFGIIDTADQSPQKTPTPQDPPT